VLGIIAFSITFISDAKDSDEQLRSLLYWMMLLVLAFLFSGHESVVHTFSVCCMGFSAPARQL